MPTARWLAFFATVAAALAAAAACGSRTGLLVPPPEHDASADVEPDVASEVGPDVPEEPEMDAGEEDALPPLDVIEEPINICPDAGSTLIYLTTTQNVLMSFYPPTGTFMTIGNIDCPFELSGSQPFSMAVDRTSGLAYMEFTSGDINRVTTTSPPVCTPTTFQPGQGNPPYPLTFGMGFAANAVDAAMPETLYIAGDNGGAVGMGSGILASIDTSNFHLTQIGAFNPIINGVELTGTGSGELFAFYGLNGMQDSAIGQIDRATAQVIGEATLPGLAMGGGWAFAFWGGDFYLFTAPNGPNTPSIVTRYRPSDGSIVQVASTNLTIVGAGVSTCAPQQ